jgi:hypothetical protein
VRAPSSRPLFPAGVAAPEDIVDDLANLRTRFWLATSVHRHPNNYAYYGDRNGEFSGSGAIRKATPNCACARAGMARERSIASLALPAN